MTDLRTAAQQALEAYDQHEPLAVVMENLRAALVEDAMQKFTDVNQELEAALAEPEPPPEAQTEAEKIAYCAGWWDALAKARAAGLFVPQAGIPEGGALYRFANLVAAAEREAIADELEHGFEDGNGFHAIYAKAIRARSNS